MKRLSTLLSAAAVALLTAIPPAAAQDGSADDVTQPMKDSIEAYFHKSLLLPELAIWKYDFTRPYPTGGTAVCGRVNYVVSTRRYYGFLPFFVRFKNGKLVEGAIAVPPKVNPIQAPTYAYRIACGPR
jgi:hypothetical protein